MDMNLNSKTADVFKSIIRVTVYVLFALLLIILGTMSYNFGRAVFSDEGYEKEPGIEVTVVIEQGEGIKEVTDKLYENGVIKDSKVFYVQSFIYQADFKAGTYTINTSASGEDIIETLSAEKSTEE